VIQTERSTETIRRVVDGVLSRDEFRPVPPREPSWLERTWDRFTDWLEDVLRLPAGLGGEVLQIALYVALALLVALLLFHVVRRLAGRGGGRAAPDPATVRAARVRELLERSRAARARGDLVEALRAAFWALVIGLSERGDLEYRDAWTNRELLERGRPRPEALQVLAPLVPDLDAKSFGRMPAVEADVEHLERLCRRYLGAA
jgi:hypothetical protein